MVEKLLKIVQVKIPTVANLSTQAQYVQIWSYTYGVPY